MAVSEEQLKEIITSLLNECKTKGSIGSDALCDRLEKYDADPSQIDEIYRSLEENKIKIMRGGGILWGISPQRNTSPAPSLRKPIGKSKLGKPFFVSQRMVSPDPFQESCMDKFKRKKSACFSANNKGTRRSLLKTSAEKQADFLLPFSSQSAFLGGRGRAFFGLQRRLSRI